MTGPPPARFRVRALVSFLMVALIWGSTWLVIKQQVDSRVPAAWAVTWRFAAATPCMFLLARMRGESLRLSPHAARLAVLVGLAQFCANFEFVYRAEQHLTSGLVAVLYALLLVPNALLSRIWLGVRVSPRFVLGSVVAMAGIGLLLLHEYRAASVHGSVLLGLGLTAAGLLSASSANVLQAGETARGQALVPMIAWAMLAGTVADAALALALNGTPVFDSRLAYLLGIGYLAVVGSVIAFPLYYSLIRDLGAGRAAYNGVAVPVIAMALSTVFEHYRWSVLAGAGAALALAGLLIALSGRSSAASPSR